MINAMTDKIFQITSGCSPDEALRLIPLQSIDCERQEATGYVYTGDTAITVVSQKGVSAYINHSSMIK